MKNKKKVIAISSLIVIIEILLIGTTYAQVLPPGNGNENAVPLDNYTLSLLAGGLAYGINYVYGIVRKKKKQD